MHRSSIFPSYGSLPSDILRLIVLNVPVLSRIRVVSLISKKIRVVVLSSISALPSRQDLVDRVMAPRVKFLGLLPNLSTLTIRAPKHPDAVAALLREIAPQITSLSLAHFSYSNSEKSAYCRFTNITALTLHPRVLRYIPTFVHQFSTSLTTLSLTAPSIHAFGYAWPPLPALRALDFCTTATTSDYAPFFPLFSYLTRLSICPIGQDLDAICAPNVQELSIGQITDNLLPILDWVLVRTALTALSLAVGSVAELTEPILERLGRASTLVALDLNESTPNVEVLARVLTPLSKLRSLSMRQLSQSPDLLLYAIGSRLTRVDIPGITRLASFHDYCVQVDSLQLNPGELLHLWQTGKSALPSFKDSLREVTVTVRPADRNLHFGTGVGALNDLVDWFPHLEFIAMEFDARWDAGFRALGAEEPTISLPLFEAILHKVEMRQTALRIQISYPPSGIVPQLCALSRRFKWADLFVDVEN